MNRNAKSKWTRPVQSFGNVVVLATSATVMALLLGGCLGGGNKNYSSCDDSNPDDPCCRLNNYQKNEGLRTDIGVSDIAIGTSDGVACRNRVEMRDNPTSLWSASKMVTGYTILKLVDQGMLSLETKAADVLDFWTATDARQHVTMRHVLSQTAGLGRYPDGLGQCTDASETTYDCAKEAYEVCFPDTFTGPGESFSYTESTFYVVSAMALKVTGEPTWDHVFQKYMAGPLGIDSSNCRYTGKLRSPAGGSLVCGTAEYGKILQAILGKTLFTNATLYDEAERPHTLDVRLAQKDPHEPEQINAPSSLKQDVTCDETMMPLCKTGGEPLDHYRHYGLGQWIECSTLRCEGGILRTSSTGAFGTYPWVDRGAVTGNEPHWGVVVRWGNADGPGLATGASLIAINDNVVPLAAEIVNPAEIERMVQSFV